MIDQQLGGDWVGDVAMEDLPMQMEIDWVRFYQKKWNFISFKSL